MLQSGVLLYGKYIRLPQSSKMWLGERQDCCNLVSLHNGNTRDCCKVVTFYSAGKNFAAISNVFCRNVTKFSKKCLLSLRRLSVWSAKSEKLRVSNAFLTPSTLNTGRSCIGTRLSFPGTYRNFQSIATAFRVLQISVAIIPGGAIQFSECSQKSEQKGGKVIGCFRGLRGCRDRL